MRVIGGPDTPDSIAYSWRMPEPRHQQARDFRVGYVLEDPFMRVSSEVKAPLEASLKALEKAGVKLQQGWPSGFSLPEFFSNYLFLLGAFDYSVSPPQEQERRRAEIEKDKDNPLNQGALAPFATWQRRHFQQLAARNLWQRYFRNVDAFLMPVLPVPAFPHDHSDMPQRTLATPEGPLPYMQGLLGYMFIAILTGLPATVAPSGRTAAGLPVGIQIMGPYLEDATPIRLAAILAKENGGFTPPPGFAS
jgi:amidase